MARVNKATKTTKKIAVAPAKVNHHLREGMFVLALGIALYLLLTLVTYHHADPAWSTSGSDAIIANAGGRFGAWLADVLLYFMGYVGYIFPIMLALFTWVLHQDANREQRNLYAWLIRLTGFLLLVASSTSLAQIWFPHAIIGIPLSAGGVLGLTISHSVVSALSDIGASVILLALMLVGLTLLAGVSWWKVSRWLGAALLASSQYLVSAWQVHRQARVAKRAVKAEQAVKKAQYDIIRPPVTEVVAKPKVVEKAVEPAKKAKKSAVIIRSRIKPEDPIVDLSNDDNSALPSISLLDDPEPQTHAQYSQTELDTLSKLVEEKLAEFNIKASVVAVYPGPVVTRFELDLAPGVKVSRITTLAKDLARSLSKTSVRIVEVIPGKSVIGLEVPNEQREMVRLKEILLAKVYQQNPSKIALGLGKDIAGNSVAIDVAKMPHMLVAGTTGSGKSVSVNAMILSILFKATPKEVRMIMIDPKMLELSIYEGIPHLLTPVVTDMKEAANALRWCVVEMDRRYRLMAALSVRNLAGFNDKVNAAIKNKSPIRDPFYPDDMDEEAPCIETLPQIVVVVDELADMMMVVGKKVEVLIARIAQKARAAGIHMILATQRPSVDVITGLIKANIPSRIAFQVSSRIDSRTILDQSGAEQLLGHGDMLYLPPGAGVPMRIHGAFVADEEVIRVVAAWKKRGEPKFVEEILSGPSEGSERIAGIDSADDIPGGDSEQDALYDKAVEIVLETRRASISSVQRRLKIGYNRAARMIEAMESAGIVSSMESNGSREVLVPKRD